MHIVFDMDNTLCDELGATARPGIADLLIRLKKDGHSLSVWTSSPKSRAYRILKDHGLWEHFGSIVGREDYDPENKGLPKDIRTVKGEFLVEDDPSQIEFVKNIGLRSFLITPYRKGDNADPGELKRLYDATKTSGGLRGLLGRLGFR